MKVIILSSKQLQDILETTGGELLKTLKDQTEVVIYDNLEEDLSNVKELKDDSEKIVLIDNYATENTLQEFSAQLDSYNNIKYLFTPYSSYTYLDLEKLKNLNIKYRNNGGANAKSVAQLAITFMFSLLSKVPVLSAYKDFADGSILGEEYTTKTAGVIGLGNVGKEILDILNKLNIPTVFYNRSKINNGFPQVDIKDLVKQDIIFVSLATNPQTIELMKNFPKLLKEHNYVVDITCFDNLYNKKEVLNLLDEDLIRGYAIEADEGLMNLKSDKNFIKTPHIGWCTVDAERRTVENYLSRALLILEGKESEIDFLV